MLYCIDCSCPIISLYLIPNIISNFGCSFIIIPSLVCCRKCAINTLLFVLYCVVSRYLAIISYSKPTVEGEDTCNSETCVNFATQMECKKRECSSSCKNQRFLMIFPFQSPYHTHYYLTFHVSTCLL